MGNLSTGQIIGGAVGLIAGAYMGNPMMGFALGFTIGGLIDPPEQQGMMGKPQVSELEIMTSKEGGAIPEVLGTTKLVGNLLWYGGERKEEVKEDAGGKGGSQEVTTGYKYYLSWGLGLCMGPVDRIWTIFREDEVVYTGKLTRPPSGEYTEIELRDMGYARVYWGTAEQDASDIMTEGLPDEELYINYRHLCFIYFDDCMIGNYNRCPTMKVVLGKWPSLPCSGDNKADPFDYNPAHACWYVLNKMAGLPATDDCVSDSDTGWMDCDSFESGAQTLKNEGLGISILFDSSQKVLSWLDAILAHVRGQIKYGADGKLHFALIRDDFEIYDLPVVDESVMLEPPTIQRKGWIETVNETKVQYARRIYLLEDEKEEECIEETITLSKDACSDKMHLETEVHGYEEDDMLVSPITGHVSESEFDRVYFKGSDAEISAYQSAANRDDDFDKITLTGSLSYTPEAGDIIVVRTTLDAPNQCEMEAVYHAAGDCPPFTFQKEVAEDIWENLKLVYQTFVGPCKLGKCDDMDVRVTNNAGQDSNQLRLDKQCDCTGVEVAVSNDFYECGQCGTILITGLTDNECCHQTVTLSDQGGTADYIKKGSMVQYTVCAPEAPCEGSLVNINANCCGSDIGSIEMGCTERDLIVSVSGSPFTPGVDTEAAVTVTLSNGSITWSLEGDGTGFSLEESETTETTLYIDGDACGSKAIVAEDGCGNTGRTIVRSTDGYWDGYSSCDCPCTGAVEEVNGAGYSITYCSSNQSYFEIAEKLPADFSGSGQRCQARNPCETYVCPPNNNGCDPDPTFLCVLGQDPCNQTANAWTCCEATVIDDCVDEEENPSLLWQFNRSCRKKFWYMNEWKCGP